MATDPLPVVVAAVSRAFPQRPSPPMDAAVLGALIHSGMSFRSVVRAIELAWGAERVAVLHEIYGLDVTSGPLAEQALAMLLEAGLNEPEVGS